MSFDEQTSTIVLKGLLKSLDNLQLIPLFLELQLFA